MQFSSHFRFYLFWDRNENHSYRYVCRRDHLKDAVSHTHGSLFVREKINPVVQACRSFRFYPPLREKLCYIPVTVPVFFRPGSRWERLTGGWYFWLHPLHCLRALFMVRGLVNVCVITGHSSHLHLIEHSMTVWLKVILREENHSCRYAWRRDHQKDGVSDTTLHARVFFLSGGNQSDCSRLLQLPFFFLPPRIPFGKTIWRMVLLGPLVMFRLRNALRACSVRAGVLPVARVPCEVPRGVPWCPVVFRASCAHSMCTSLQHGGLRGAPPGAASFGCSASPSVLSQCVNRIPALRVGAWRAAPLCGCGGSCHVGVCLARCSFRVVPVARLAFACGALRAAPSVWFQCLVSRHV